MPSAGKPSGFFVFSFAVNVRLICHLSIFLFFPCVYSCLFVSRHHIKHFSSSFFGPFPSFLLYPSLFFFLLSQLSGVCSSASFCLLPRVPVLPVLLVSSLLLHLCFSPLLLLFFSAAYFHFTPLLTKNTLNPIMPCTNTTSLSFLSSLTILSASHFQSFYLSESLLIDHLLAQIR